MKYEKRPFSVTPSPEFPEPTELDKIKAKMLSDVAVALIGRCETYPDVRRLAEDAIQIVEICLSDGMEVEK